MSAVRAGALWIVAAAGCYRPELPPGVPCSSSQQCPGDQVCVGGVCDGTPDPAVDAGGDGDGDGEPAPIKIVIGEDDQQVRDTEISETDPMRNFVDQDHDSIDGDETALLLLDVSAIPQTATVLAATLTVTTADQAARDGGTVEIFRLRESWVASQVTWAERSTGVPWSSQGALPPSRDSDPIAEFRPNVIGRAFEVELPPQLIADWVAQPADNNGIALVRGTAEEHIHLRSEDSGRSSTLTVTIRP